MKFAIFYEIPVPRPWGELSEYHAFKNTLTQAIAAEKAGFDSFWTVEHHFLEEFSHCSNPEVLYGAVAASTERLRIGYGVRLGPKPYNHPVRSAESAAVLDLLSDGRVEFGTGRSSTRTEIEGFGLHPNDTREMWHEAVEHIVDCWVNEYSEFQGKHWSLPRRRVQPKPLQKPHPPVWGATGSPDGHRMMGELGLGLLSFSVGTPPEQLKQRIDLYRQGIAACTKPLGAFVNDRAACFTMVNCAPTKDESYAVSRESFAWYAKNAAELAASVLVWLEEMKAKSDGTYAYLDEARQAVEQRLHELASLEALLGMNAVIAGDPDEVITRCKAYEATGADLLLCLVNPYKISHEKVMQTIDLMGKYVIPEFEDARTPATGSKASGG
jgi:alkanesulfonate monooxygenase SsuD/methylene tetrahydromethanopterin reductase-like flavin-dependent oxidoreductase (luciferase family)